MKISELIHMQQEFQEPRGLNHINTPEVTFVRTLEEVNELWDEIAEQNWNNAVVELADVFIMMGSLALAITKETGMTPAEFEQVVMNKFAHNENKYDVTFFQNGLMAQAAMRMAKNWYDNDLDNSWHHEEDF